MRVRNEVRILLGILVAGVLLRALYLAEIVDAPGFTAPQVDADYHDYWARALVSGDFTPPPLHADPALTETPYFRPPGYPYFLAFIYLLTDSSYFAARVAQMGLGLLSAGVAFCFGRCWFGARMALIFAALVATYWGFIYFEGDLLEPALFSILTLILLWDLSLWTKPVTFAHSLRSGALLGLCALVRPNVLLFAPAIAIWVIWVAHGGRMERSDSSGWGRAWSRQGSLRGIVGLASATALTIAPITLRNYLVGQDFVPISANAGINLLLGNNPNADGLMSASVPGVGEFDTCFDYPALVRAAETQVGHSLKYSEASAHFTQQAWQHIKGHPLQTLKATWRKALLFWGPLEVGNNREDELERAHSAVLSRIPGSFATATSLALIGALSLVLRRKEGDERRLRVAALVALFILTYFLSNLPYFAAGRFRMPVVPALFFFGAIGLERMSRYALARDYRGLAPWVLGLGVTYGVSSRNFAEHQPSEFKWHYDRGVRFAADRNADEAMREYQTALSIKPDSSPALFNLGSLHEFKGEVDEAIGKYEAALRVNPNDFLSHRSLARILAERGHLEFAASHYLAALRIRASPSLYVDYAGVLLRQKKDDDAERAYQNAINLDVSYAPAHNNLAVLLFLKADYSGAWREVALSRKYGGVPAAGFLKALEQRLPEP